MVNYFSFFEEGLRFSYNATFAVQFAPLAILEISDEVKKTTKGKRGKKENEDIETKKKKQTRLFLAHSHDERILLNETVGILSNSIKHFKKALSQNAEIGFYSPPIKTRNLSEGAVRLAEYFIGNSYELISDTGIAIRLYSFSNAGQYANVSFVDLPASIYRFISKARRFAYFNNLKDFFSSLQWDEYEKFVEGESIAYKFFDRENNRLRTDWKLFELYLTEVEEMPHQDLQTIVYVGTQFYQHIKTVNQKPLKELEQIGKGKFGEYKRLLLSVHKQTPLCTTEQFQILAPDVESEEIKNWLLVRDLILFRVYECQHNEQLTTEKLQLPQIDSKLSPRLQVQIQVADRLFDYYTKNKQLNRISRLELVKTFQDFFFELLAIQKTIKVCATEELQILFPQNEDGQIMWNNTLNIILFRIYECIHTNNLQKEVAQ